MTTWTSATPLLSHGAPCRSGLFIYSQFLLLLQSTALAGFCFVLRVNITDLNTFQLSRFKFSLLFFIIFLRMFLFHTQFTYSQLISAARLSLITSLCCLINIECRFLEVELYDVLSIVRVLGGQLTSRLEKQSGIQNTSRAMH